MAETVIQKAERLGAEALRKRYSYTANCLAMEQKRFEAALRRHRWQHS